MPSVGVFAVRQVWVHPADELMSERDVVLTTLKHTAGRLAVDCGDCLPAHHLSLHVGLHVVVVRVEDQLIMRPLMVPQSNMEWVSWLYWALVIIMRTVIERELVGLLPRVIAQVQISTKGLEYSLVCSLHIADDMEEEGGLANVPGVRSAVGSGNVDHAITVDVVARVPERHG